MNIHSVCILGDSVAKGVVFDAAKKKYRLLRESFANLVEQQEHISILNLAKFGCTITMGGEILKRHETELNRYDYTIMEFGGNDCDYNWARIAEDPFGQHLCNTPIPQFREKYMDLIRRVQNSGGTPVLLNLPPIDAKRYFRWVSKGLDKKNILAFLGGVEMIYKWQEMYSKTVEELAAEEHIPLIDIRSGFLNKRNFSYYLCADGIHPNIRGHRLIERAIRKRAFS